MSKFYWFNRGNWQEWGGPYDTIEEAKNNCVVSYKSIDVKETGPISILQQVASGQLVIDTLWSLEMDLDGCSSKGEKR